MEPTTGKRLSSFGEEIQRLTKKCAYLEDQHQQDCIRINELTTTVNTLTRLYAQLRKTVGMD